MYKALLVSILAIAVPGGRHARQPAPAAVPDDTCANVKFETPSGQTLPPDRTFTPSGTVITVEVHFTATFNGAKSAHLTDGLQKQDVCEAARRFGAVWSSREFRDALANYPYDFIVSRNWLGHTTPKKGKDLVGPLTAHRTIVMNVSGSTDDNGTNGGCGLSPGTGQETLLDEPYLAGKDQCGPNLLVIDLTNTLSHEYTHYPGSIGDQGAESSDKHAPRTLKPYFVSYGIGCITQLLAFPGSTCLTGPQPGLAASDTLDRTGNTKP